MAFIRVTNVGRAHICFPTSSSSSLHPGNYARDWCSVSSASLTVGGTPPRVRDCRRGNIPADIPSNPLDILTGEGQSAAAAARGRWLAGTASGERNLVASGMDTVGALDPEEVRALEISTVGCIHICRVLRRSIRKYCLGLSDAQLTSH